jgi:tetratricopeptide (TPR) repeat protein
MADHRQDFARVRQLQQAGRLDEAERLCREIVARDENNTAALRALAGVLGQRGELDAAEELLMRAARLEPHSPETSEQLRVLSAVKQFRQGMLLAGRQKADDAIACMRLATVQWPQFAEAHRGLGILLAGRQKFAEAADAFRRFAELDRDNAEAHYNLALALQNCGKLDEAEAHYRRALELNPRHGVALNNLATVLAAEKRPAEAEEAYRKAIECEPDFAPAHANLAELMLKQNRPDEAERCCRRALELTGGAAGAHYDLAVALAAQNKLDEAEAEYRKTIEAEPENPDAHVGLSSVLLMGGRFAEGWREYEWRLKHKDMPKSELPTPQWRGEPLSGRTILLRAEQGAGDTIQFIRFAQVLKRQGCTVVAGATPSLSRLLARAPGVDSVLVGGGMPVTFDLHVPLLSVPGILGITLENIPAEVPYLRPAETSIAGWRDELGSDPVLRVGIAWQGNPKQQRDEFRSIPLARFSGLARIPGVRLYSLQFGVGRDQLQIAADWPLVDFAEGLGDFHRTAALVRNLDLVISCDSAPAHLAGALAMPVWLVLAYSADWRWLVNRADSPWYPTMRIFRQPRPGDWEGAFRQIEEALPALVATKLTRGGS